MMTGKSCLSWGIIFTLFSINGSPGQITGYKPNYNFQTIGRQTSSQNVVPNKNNYNPGLNYGKTVLQPAVKAPEAVPHVEVMDFFVPSYPYAGEDVELTCGYKHQDGLTFQKIEWHRITEHTEVRSH